MAKMIQLFGLLGSAERALEVGKQAVRSARQFRKEVREMKPWPKHPVIYEINTWVWLDELSRKYGRPVNLATVPPEEWDAIAALDFDAVWFMGVWERSPAGIEISMRKQGSPRGLPAGPSRLFGGGQCRLALLRAALCRRWAPRRSAGARSGPEELAQRGIRLILDFVPNHVAPDHPWVGDHPEYFVQGNADDAEERSGVFIEAGGKVFACGRDPFFPAWPDVLQLNAFQPGLRQAVIETLPDIAGQCDGVRCDMAMLMLNTIFERTWGSRAGARPAEDYWTTLSRQSRKRILSSCSWPRHTGTWSGNCSSRVSTTATTRDSTTGWNTRLPRTCACTSARTLPTRENGPVHREP